MAYSDADRLLTVRGTLTYPDTGTQALTSAHISSFLVNEDAGRDVPVGAAPAASFELKLDNSSGQWEPGGSILGAHVLDGAKVEIEIGLWNGATYDYSDIGTYYIDDVQGQEHETLIRLKGSDAMVSLMSEYYADGAGDYPQTLSSLLTDIAATAGVTLESSTFTNSTVSIPAQPAWKNNLTCREAVGYIAACAGGIARFNRAGKLEIAPLEKVSSRAVSTSVYKTIQKGDTFFGGLNAINVYAYGAPDGTSPSRYATTPATPDTSLNSINIKGNPILAHGSTALAALGAGMLSALTGLAFRGATFEWHGDPAMELGELCTVTDLSSTAIPILITKQTLRFAPGFSMNSGCAVTTSTKADASGKLQKIFTPTGNLNAEALAGNIYVKAGEKMTLESGGIMNVLSGGEMNIASGGKLTLASGNDVDIGADTLADLLAAATSQTTIWYQDNQPTATATGDIWYDTDASPVTIKRWDGSAWVDITTTALSQALTAAGTAQATADGKIKAWAQTTAPSATAVGDLWIDTDDNNKLYRATAAGTGNWVLYKVAAGYVSTSHITIDNDSIDIVSGGDINVASGGKINLTSADDLIVSSGKTLSAYANDEITFAVGGIQVGGTNLISGTSASYRDAPFPSVAESIITDYIPVSDDGAGVFAYRIYINNTSVRPLKITVKFYNASYAQVSNINGNYVAAGTQGFSTVIGASVAAFDFVRVSLTSEGSWLYAPISYKALKMERGNKATDWSPAPEDPASGVKTSYISIDSDSIDISSGGTLTLNAADDIKIGSGGDTLASTIDLSANNSIKLAVGGIQVGGTNLIKNSKFSGSAVGWIATGSTLSQNADFLRFTTNNTGGTAGITSQVNHKLSEIVEGETYTMTIKARMTTGTPINVAMKGVGTLAFTGFTWSEGPNQIQSRTFVANANVRPDITILKWMEPVGSVIDLYWIKLERGNKATDWSPHPEDPASGVKTSFIDIATDHIDISSGGNLSITSPNTLKITSGTTNATALAVRNDTDYFISAGHLTQSSAPFWIKKDGSIKATSGTIGGFTIGSNSLSAQPSGKPLLKLDTANSKIQIGVLEILGISGPYGDAGSVGTGSNELNLVGEPVTINSMGLLLVEITDSVAWFRSNVSALSFTDRTIGYDGNAVADLKRIRNDKDGNIDHSTLPTIAKRTIQAKGKTEEGRDLGAMISILTKAVQELDERLEKIEDRIK